jgi:nucleoside-diphosphate-sugar epimerase
MSKVLVFGATGSVGSVVASTSKKLGADVVVATRSLDKKIPGVSSEDEKEDFTRVKADLDDAQVGVKCHLSHLIP